MLALFRAVEGVAFEHAGHDHGAAGGSSGSGAPVPGAPATGAQTGSGVEVIAGTAAADVFKLGNAGLVYYKDAYGAAGKDGNYALIKDFKKGDKISLVCDEMGEYSILACDMGETIGICSCIYYNNDDQTGAHIDLIACITGPDALKLDLMDASTFIWDITPSAIDSAGAATNDILFLSSTSAPIGAAGSDVLHGSQGEDRFVGVDPDSSFPGRGEVDVLIGLPGADTFVLGGLGKVYYVDPLGQSARSYAAIQDFEKGDKIVLVCDEMGEYSLQNCSVGLSEATCIYYDRDGIAGVGLTDELIAMVQGPDALRLDLMDASTFIWDITPSAIDSAGAATNDILFLSSTSAPIGAAGSDVLHGSQGEDRFVGVDPDSSFPGRGEVDVLIGLPGADTFVLGGLGKVYYVDPLGQSARSYAAIQDFEKGDKIVLVCDEMGEYSLQNCSVGLSEATCIYYDRDGIAGVGLTDELIAMVQGPDALRLDLMDASTFIWDIPGSAIDATGSATNDILIGTDAADKLIGKAGGDVIIGAMGNDQLIGVNQSDPIPGRGEVDVLIGAPGADTFVLGAAGLTYYLDPIGLSSNSYAAIQDFENGDKIFLTGNKAEYVLLDRLIGVSPATCIYFNRDGAPGVGAQDDLIAAVQGPASQKLDLNSNSFIWDSANGASAFKSDFVHFNRLFDPISGVHLFSANSSELSALTGRGYKNEGIGWSLFAPSGGEINGLSEVHRLYNPATSKHLLTISDGEVSAAKSSGWNYEGIIGRAYALGQGSENSVKRYFNASTGDHLYTSSATEAASLPGLGYSYEGNAWSL